MERFEVQVDQQRRRIERIAAAEAIRRVPTEYGMYDVRARLKVFGEQCVAQGYIPFLGVPEDYSDEEVEYLAEQYGLDQ